MKSKLDAGCEACIKQLACPQDYIGNVALLSRTGAHFPKRKCLMFRRCFCVGCLR